MCLHLHVGGFVPESRRNTAMSVSVSDCRLVSVSGVLRWFSDVLVDVCLFFLLLHACVKMPARINVTEVLNAVGASVSELIWP